MLDVAIIGGGLSGLSLALALDERQQQVAVFDARNQFGGRIQSYAVSTDYRLDVGAGWVWPDFQPRISHFLRANNIQVFEQWQQGSSSLQTSRDEAPQALILYQQVRLFGDEAAVAEEIIIKDWFDDSHTAVSADINIPMAHPEYGHKWLQLDHWNDKLYF